MRKENLKDSDLEKRSSSCVKYCLSSLYVAQGRRKVWSLGAWVPRVRTPVKDWSIDPYHPPLSPFQAEMETSGEINHA